MVVRRSTHNATENFVSIQKMKNLLQVFADYSVPIDMHGRNHGGMRQNSRRPFHRMNLRHQRRIDQAGLLKELFVAPVRVFQSKLFANGIVLGYEQGMQHA